LLHGLRHGDIDFLVGALRDPVPVNDVVQQPLFRAALVIVARPDHPLAGRVDVSADELLSFPWMLPPVGTPTREHFSRFFGERAMLVEAGLVESSSQILMRGLLMNSDRLTLVSRQQVQFEVELGQLAIISFDLGDTLRDIGLTFREDWQPTDSQRDFLNILRTVARRHSEA
jgi:DNA-binding transcriptional LysR family regulator